MTTTHILRARRTHHLLRPGRVTHVLRADERGNLVVPPVNLSPPTITGTLFGGETLTGSQGTWTGSPDSYAYQWEYIELGGDWADLDGKTSIDVTPTYAQMRGRAFRLKVTAINGAGPGVAYSNVITSVIYDLLDTYSPDLLHDYVETTGTTLTDLSGNNVDGTVVGGMILAQTALIDGFPYAIDTNAVGRISSDPGWDWSTEDWTCALAFQSADTGVAGVWLQYDPGTGARIGLFMVSGSLRGQTVTAAGTPVTQTATGGPYNDDSPHRLALRWIASTRELQVWVDGVSRLTMTGGAMSAPSARDMRWGGWGVASVSSVDGPYQMLLGVKRSLTDAECVTLSGGE